MEITYLSLGSNIGNRQQHIAAALKKMSENNRITILRVAPIYETAPWGNENQDWFLNTVAEIETSLTPQELLEQLANIEKALGRTREQHWGPRTIDLDILLYGQKQINLPNLQIPHPRMTQRAFVLAPLADLCPDMILPDGQNINTLLKKVATQELKLTLG
ncbi:hypothetical protein N752_22695 [Desulforamulus aquiferis]|nr:2-amino-4-hydroxy-6-hydroxymethyldihydropteridine diphosphokinase [Desulforamulus aquiferis]RYD02826.1 hypothetical protein N752_22695 [Desulforamulus aquiferis]